MAINDKDYWDLRFQTDWTQFAGEAQTEYFAHMLLDNLPTRLLHTMATENLSIADYGCACGECAALIKRTFGGLSVKGVDFSETAIEAARSKFPACQFEAADILNKSIPCDIAVCSNVLEHLTEPDRLIKKLMENASQYVIILVPFEEPVDSGILEHVQRFTSKSFLPSYGDFSLVFSRRILPYQDRKQYWPYLQMLLVYAKGQHSLISIEDMERIDAEKLRLASENERLKATRARYEKRIKGIESVVARHEQAEDAVLRYVMGFTANHSAKLVAAVKRARLQLLSGGLQGKRDFIKWLGAARMRECVPDAKYNPFWDIYETARKTFEACRMPCVSDETSPHDDNHEGEPVGPTKSYCKFDVLFFSVIDYAFRYQRPQQIADYYARNGHRVFYFNAHFGVGVGSQAVVKETHENLFEVTLTFGVQRRIYDSSLSDLKEALLPQLKTFLRRYAVHDAVVISEYPNWADAVRFLRHGYAVSHILDYLDDWDGFEDTATPELVHETHEMFSISDCVIASSQYLADKAAAHSKNEVLVRNGTEFAHFNRVANYVRKNGERQKIGYYGAIAHWFDAGKIKALAEALPDVEIELIGEVSTDVSCIKKFANVKLLGEKPYCELPVLIQDWSVCLIPFDTSTSLIKATNPVKFYEYLSAGKKVVATEIPEISDFAGRYVLLANDDAVFVSHVKACLADRDGLLPPAERMDFARKNDWQCRLEAIDAAVKRSTPRFSIVVLTFEQLEYTKLCLASILEWTAYPNYELIVVDNASTDGTADYLRELAAKHPQMKVILNKTNLGFASGNNVGLRAATGDYLVLLNNDTIVPRGWISRFLAHFRAHPECGAACPVTNSIGNEAEVNVNYQSLSGFLAEANERAMTKAFEFTDMPKSLAMFCLCVPRNVYEEIGPISEEYGRGMFEDDDYCQALLERGYELHCLEDVLVHHFHSVSFSAIMGSARQEEFARNRAIFETKWKCAWEMHKYRKGVTGDSNLKTGSHSQTSLPKGGLHFDEGAYEEGADSVWDASRGDQDGPRRQGVQGEIRT